MAWGFFFPSTFGKFFPDGEFEREDQPGSSQYWRRLDRHYNLKFDDEKKRLLGPEAAEGRYPSYVAKKLNSEDGTRYQEVLPKDPSKKVIEPHELPRSFDIGRPCQALGDVFKTNERILAVSEPMKNLIERFESGVHQFFPIVVTDPIKGATEQKYYIFIIGLYLNGFRPDKSASDSFNKEIWNYRFEKSRGGVEGLALAKEIIANSHIWTERRFTSSLFCLSDELEGAISDARLAIPKHYRVMEV